MSIKANYILCFKEITCYKTGDSSLYDNVS